MESSQDEHDWTSDNIQAVTPCIAACFLATTSDTRPDLHRAPVRTVSRSHAALRDAAPQQQLLVQIVPSL